MASPPTYDIPDYIDGLGLRESELANTSSNLEETVDIPRVVLTDYLKRTIRPTRGICSSSPPCCKHRYQDVGDQQASGPNKEETP